MSKTYLIFVKFLLLLMNEIHLGLVLINNNTVDSRLPDFSTIYYILIILSCTRIDRLFDYFTLDHKNLINIKSCIRTDAATDGAT